jgi:hypothetical protein
MDIRRAFGKPDIWLWLMCLAAASAVLLLRPHHLYVDETYTIDQAYEVMDWPAGYFRGVYEEQHYTWSLALALVLKAGRAAGLTSLGGMVASLRIFGAAFALTIGYWTFRRLGDHLCPGAGPLAAALTLTSSYWMLFETRVMKDIPTAVFLMLSFYLFFRGVREGRTGMLFSGSLAYGFSWMIRHAALGALPTFLAAAFMFAPDVKRRGAAVRAFFAGQALAFGAFALIDYATRGDPFFTFAYVWGKYVVGETHLLWTPPTGPDFYAYAAWAVFKPPVLALAAIGFIIVFREDRRSASAVAAMIVPYLALASASSMKEYRYILPMMPLAYILCSAALLRAFRGRRLAYSAACAALLAFNAYPHHPTYSLQQIGFDAGLEGVDYTCLDFERDFDARVAGLGAKEGMLVVSAQPCLFPLASFRPMVNSFSDIGLCVRGNRDGFYDSLSKADFVVVGEGTATCYGDRVYEGLRKDGRFREFEVEKSGDDRAFRLRAFARSGLLGG